MQIRAYLLLLFVLISMGNWGYAQSSGLKLEGNFNICETQQTYDLVVINASDKTYSNFRVDWGDGSPAENMLQSSASHEYKFKGRYTLVFYGQNSAGREESVSYVVVIDNGTPVLEVKGGGESKLCVGDEIKLVLGSIQSNTNLTHYVIDYGDNSELVEFLGSDYPGVPEVALTHKYRQSYCDMKGNTGEGVEITITAYNACNEKYSYKAGPYKIASPVQLYFNLPDKECTENEINLAGLTGVNPEDCMPVTYSWEITDETGTTQKALPIHVFHEPGVYRIKARGKRNNAVCSQDSLVKEIRIIRRVKAVVTPEQGVVCENQGLVLDASASAGEEKKYTWRVKQGNAAQVEFQPNAYAEKPTVIFKKYGSYVVQLTVDNGCSEDTKDIPVEVKSDPEIVQFKPFEASCPGATFRLSDYIVYDWKWSGNPHVPTWTINGTPGGWKFVLGDNHAEYPTIRFTQPGTYTLQVDLQSAGCAGKKLSATQTVEIYDSVIHVDIVPDVLELCEGGTATFTNHSAGVNLSTRWQVTDAEGREAGITPQISGDQVRVTFPVYGKYRVVAVLEAVCGQKQKVFEVAVRRAPEIAFTMPFPNVCPDRKFYLSPYVNYLPNGNDRVEVQWKADGPGQVLIDGGNTFTPKMEFTQWGEYTIQVTLVNPTACGPTNKLTASQKLMVNNPEQMIDIEPDRTTICMGQWVTMQNHSVVAIEPAYNWSVSPEAGVVFDAVHHATSADPKIQFTQSGIYRITGAVQGACEPATVLKTIVVQQDPEVKIDALPAICPGLLELDTLVHYNWHDDWKENPESQRVVEWKLTSAPAGADYTPAGSPEWDQHYPHLELNTPGMYQLQATLRSYANCGGELTDSRTIEVYSPDIQVDVQPAISPDWEQLPDGRYQIVEGVPMTFVNRSTGVGLTYHWSVDQVADCEISDPAHATPAITFHAHGTYKVRVDIQGTCASDFKEFTVVVKGIPKFTFAPIDNRCDNWEALDLRDYLTCDSAGSTVINCNWKITPGNGYEFTEGNTGDMFFKVRFLKNGIYTLTLEAVAEYGGVQTVTQTVRVLRSEITPAANFVSREGCTDDDFYLKAANVSDGDSLAYHWEITPDGWMGDLAQKDLNVRMMQQGNYTVTLEASNICDARQEFYEIRAYSKPEVEVLQPEDLGEVCELGYLFAGEEHIGEIRENNDPLTAVHWEISPGGGSFANGTVSSDLRPDLEFAGGETYTIRAEYKNHCREAATVTFHLQVDKFEAVSVMADTSICAFTEAIPLVGLPSGGDWTASQEGFVTDRGGKNFYFNPWKNEKEKIRVVYTRGNGKCISRDSAYITVHALPVVEAGENRDVCLNWEAQELTGFTPYGGIWQGAGIQGEEFHPEEAGVGEKRLEYWYTDPNTRCVNLDTLVVTVHELPDAAFHTAAKHCSGIDSVFIPVQLGIGNTFRWNFGDGSVRESTEPIAHAYTLAGIYQVSVECTSVYGCVSHFGPVAVEALNQPPLALFDVDTNRGCGPLDIQVYTDPDHYAGEHLDLAYAWVFGNGATSDLLQPQPAAVTFQPRPSDTTYTIRFKVYNVCGSADTVQHILVHSSPVAKFYMNPEEEGCDPLEVNFINVSTGSGNEYAWTFGDGNTSVEAHPSPHIYRTGSRATAYEIRLIATNLCNRSEAVDTVTVKPNSLLVRFTKDKKYICAGTTVCFTNFSTDTVSTILNQYWDFGDGKRSTDWDVCHLYEDSTGRLPVTVTVDNGCAKASFTDTVVVYPVPRLSIEPVKPACEDERFTFVLSSDQILKKVQWELGDGTEAAGMWVEHVYEEPGSYQAVVQVELAEIPSCQAKDSIAVEVWSKPRVTITPLDTVACPPFLYRPGIQGTAYDYFRWDYGDGTELTSEMEHLYTNEDNFSLEYDIVAYVENNRGCREEHRGHIKVYNGPHAALDRDISYGRPEKVRFINLSKDYTECIWYLPDGRVVHSPEDQEMMFDEENTYPLSLVVVNEFGCRDSLHLDHISYMGGLYFPNTFIPHSANAKVNRFNGIGMGLKEYHLEIFDLYGNKVWETRALSAGEPAGGWDGKNTRGEMLPQGVYVWRAKAIFFSEDVWTGKNNRSGNSQTTQGTVLLLRE